MLWFILIIFIISIILIVKIFLEIFLEKTPFIPTPRQTIFKILEEITIKPNDFIYDLGCGNGRFLFLAYQKQPKAFYFGIEKKIFPYFWAKIIQFFKKFKDKNITKNIKFFLKDIFEINLSSADFIYLYLTPFLLEKLESKLLKELKPGAKIISCDFPLKKFSLLKEIELKGNKELGRKIFFYQR